MHASKRVSTEVAWWRQHRRAFSLVGKLLKLQVVGIIETLKFLFDGRTLSSADGAAARVLLLFLHLLQHSVLLHLNKRFPLIFTKAKPEFLDALSLLLIAGTPNLIAGYA